MLTDHLAEALISYCQRLRRDGRPIPPELEALRDAFHADAVRRRQVPSFVAPAEERVQPEAVTIKQAAAISGVSPSTIERRLRDGSLPKVPGLGRSVRIPLAALRGGAS
jgi:excisionase family DNA binding protein